MTHFCTRLQRRIFLVAAVYSFFVCIHSRAVTTSWNTNANGSFATAANWDNGVPDSNDTAVFDRGFVAYEVNFPGGLVFDPPPNYQVENLRVHTNEVGFVWVSSPFATVPRLSVLDPALSVVVGVSAGDVAILNMTLNPLSGANASIGYASGAEGTLNVSGTFSLSGTLDVGDGGVGTLNVAGGGLVESSTGNIGHFVSGRGFAIVTGPNSQWINSSALNVGVDGQGTLTIQDGGRVSSATATFSRGVATVTGVNSQWSNSGFLRIGDMSGGGRLTIQDGGAVSCDTSVIGFETTGGFAGQVIVTGAGSTWTLNGGSLAIGSHGGGGLTIAAGAVVSLPSPNSGSSLGTLVGNGSATVTGVGSRWTTGRLDVGDVGVGNLTISAGGAVVSDSAKIGATNSGRGTVSVDGVASTWTVSGDLTIGEDGFGALETLIVTHGGAVSVGGQLLVERQGLVAGNGTLSGIVVNRGYVAPGFNVFSVTNVVPGALDIDGSYLQAASGRLSIRLGGTTSGFEFYDQLQVSGAVTLNGTLAVALANSFAPSVGDAFDILDWGNLSGTFDNLGLPPLGAGLMWNSSQLYTTGVLSVARAGDYNFDGAVNAADFVVWRKLLGQIGDALAADGNGDGIVSSADYDVWRGNFGSTAGSGNGSAANAAVPEPTTLTLVLLSSLCLACRRAGRF